MRRITAILLMVMLMCTLTAQTALATEGLENTEYIESENPENPEAISYESHIDTEIILDMMAKIQHQLIVLTVILGGMLIYFFLHNSLKTTFMK